MLLKFKKFTKKNAQGESWDIYIPVGFKPVDERPDWVKNAAKMLATLNCEEVKRYSDDSSNTSLQEVGVMDGNLGKRMYIKYFSEMGLRHYTRCDGFMTFGLRGENDIIFFVSALDSNTITYPGTDTEDMRMREIVSNETTIHDNFNGETYSHCSIHDSDEGDTITYTLNGNEITKYEFDSAQSVVYFKDIGSSGNISIEDKSRFIYKCENNFGKLTLANLYDLARVMTD